MKNNRGVTLVSVAVVLVIILIISSVSIIGGGGLIFESKEQVEEQEITAIETAIRKRKTEVGFSGTLTPGGVSYVGLQNPVVGRDDAGTELYAGKNWYLLEKEHLKQLGIDGNSNSYVVNYELEVVLPVNGEYAVSLYNEIMSY